MQIKSILAAAAIALAATIGSASAADPFSTLKGISADVMTPSEMTAVVGTANLRVTSPTAPNDSAARPPVTGELDITAAATGLGESAVEVGVIPVPGAAAVITP